MSKVLIDRELAERVCHVDNSTRQTARRELRTILATPSGTPAMPVKAYYHEAPNEYGGLNKSVGLEVRKEFADAPLVLESDALARIACLEGEIAKRDETIARLEADNRSKNGSLKAFGEQIAGLQKAVRNRERLVGLRDARILELESQYQRDVFGLNNEGDPIGGDPAGGYANDNARLRTELAAIKAQEPVSFQYRERTGEWNDFISARHYADTLADGAWPIRPLYAAPVSESKAQGVVMPEREEFEGVYSAEYGTPVSVLKLLREGENYIEKPQHSDRLNSSWWMWQKACARLNAAHAKQVSVPDERIIPTSAELIQWAWEEEPEETRFQEGYSAAKRWVKMQIEAGIAAPEAPAADAGIVDMYRHLQKVTPYRFKKIQDASITDGGDVMYFHKDRFDAALLADMAAHCAAKGVV